MQNASSQATGEAMPAFKVGACDLEPARPASLAPTPCQPVTLPVNAASLVNDALTTMLASTSRRAVLRTAANAGAATGAVAMSTVVDTPPVAAEMSDASDIETTLSAYLAEARNLRRLEDAHSEASNRLPAWAAPGPETMFSDGRKGGGLSGWPERAVLPTPDPERHSIRYTIRPSPRETWKRATLMIGGSPMRFQRPDGTIDVIPPSSLALANRRRQRLAGFAAVRKVLARIREQRAERERLGLPQLDKAMSASCDRLYAMEDRLCEMAVGVSPTSIAVVTLFEFMHGERDFSLSLLRRLAPSLTGLVRVVVDNMIDKEPDAMRDTLLAGGERIA